MMLRPALLVVVAVCLCAGVMGYSVNHELEHDIEELKRQVHELQQHGACHHEQVHLHIHGDVTGEEHHGSHDDIHVHFHLHEDDDHHEHHEVVHHDEHSGDHHEVDHHDEHSGDHHEVDHHDEHSGDHHEVDHHDEHSGDHHEVDHHDEHSGNYTEVDHHDEHSGDHHEVDHHDEHSGDHHEVDHHDEHSGDHHESDHHDEHSGEHHHEHHDEHDIVYAHCAMHSDVTSAVHGHVFITQHTDDEHAEIEVDVFDLPKHNEDVHLTVYEHGDVSDGCSSLVGHDELGSADVGTTDGTGEIDTTLAHTEFSVKGLHSIMGRPVAIEDKDHAPMACCMVSWSSGKEHHEETQKDHEEARKHHHDVHEEHHDVKDDAHVGQTRKRSAVHPKLLAKYL